MIGDGLTYSKLEPLSCYHSMNSKNAPHATDREGFYGSISITELVTLRMTTVPRISCTDLARISKSRSECITRLSGFGSVRYTGQCCSAIGMVTLDSLPSERVLQSHSKIAACMALDEIGP